MKRKFTRTALAVLVTVIPLLITVTTLLLSLWVIVFALSVLMQIRGSGVLVYLITSLSFAENILIMLGLGVLLFVLIRLLYKLISTNLV